MSGGIAQEARRDQRVPVDLEIRFRYPEVFKGRMRNLCAGGLGAEIPIAMDIDSPVEVEILQGRLLASGHVRWISMDEGTVRIGIQFRQGERDIIRQVHQLRGRAG